MRTTILCAAPLGLLAAGFIATAATVGIDERPAAITFLAAPSSAEGVILAHTQSGQILHLTIDLDALGDDAPLFAAQHLFGADSLALGHTIAFPMNLGGWSHGLPGGFLFALAAPSLFSDGAGDLDSPPRPGNGGSETVVPVPTPLAATLAGAGLAGVVGSRRRAKP